MSEVGEDVDVVCRPLDSLEQVLGWEQPDNGHLNTASLPLTKRNVHSVNQPRTLICHDMKGGYLNDRWVQGDHAADSYRFFHWSHVDIYVYFSHSFITIPPPCWVDAAHLHGVPVLGTLITESEGGAKICRTLFDGRDPYLIKNFIQKLVDIAVHYKFEGWLINIENPVEVEHVRNLQNFLYWLTVKMRGAITGSYVIWYDSVTVDGELKWQDELNQANKRFFDACDGIYLNYNWNDEKLSNSVRLASQRVADVYVGVDVFGRGTPGGGGFNSDLAFKSIRNAGLSVALFAPGWVHEVLGAEQFTNNEYKFWSLLSDFNPVHGPAQLPFTSNFCQGFGEAVHRRGKVLVRSAWSNQSLQQYQPTDHSFYNGDNATHRLAVTTSHAYSGGGSLSITGPWDTHHIPLFRLLLCEFELRVSLLVTYTFKYVSPPPVGGGGEEDSMSVGLLLTIGDKSDQVKAELLLAADDRATPPALAHGQTVTVLPPIDPQVQSDLQLQGIYIPTKPEHGWITRSYMVSPEYDEAFIKNISLSLSVPRSEQPSYEFLLGQIQLIPMHLLLERHELRVWCVHSAISRVSGGDSMGVTAIVTWSGEHKQLLNHYDVYCRVLWTEEGQGETAVTRYVNATRRSAYKLNAFPMPYPPSSGGRFRLRFIVQEHCAGLHVPSVDRAPYAQIHFQ